jgi:hypothetical protein
MVKVTAYNNCLLISLTRGDFEQHLGNILQKVN